MRTIILIGLILIASGSWNVQAQGLDQDCNPIAVPPECRQLSDSINTLENRIARLQQRLEGASPAAKPDLLRTIRRLNSELDAAKTDFRRCMREHGATPRELAPNELTANVTGTATLETENRDARGPFNADLDMDVRFSRNRCNVTITRFPSISVRRRIRGQNVTITVTKTGGGSGSFHPVSGRMNIPIRLHFRYSHPLAPDDDANFSLSTDDSITRNNGDVVTGSPVNAEGDIRLVGAGRFRNGVLSPSDGTLVIRANIPPRP